MWTTSYETETPATPRAVWGALRDLHSGTRIGPNSDDFVLNGPFAVGTTLTVTPRGQESMQSEIVTLEPERVYADVTRFGDLALTFRHELTPSPTGGTIVRHVLEIDGVGADVVAPELGPQISEDFPVAMAELVAAAEASAEVRSDG